MSLRRIGRPLSKRHGASREQRSRLTHSPSRQRPPDARSTHRATKHIRSFARPFTPSMNTSDTLPSVVRWSMGGLFGPFRAPAVLSGFSPLSHLGGRRLSVLSHGCGVRAAGTSSALADPHRPSTTNQFSNTSNTSILQEYANDEINPPLAPGAREQEDGDGECHPRERGTPASAC